MRVDQDSPSLGNGFFTSRGDDVVVILAGMRKIERADADGDVELTGTSESDLVSILLSFYVLVTYIRTSLPNAMFLLQQHFCRSLPTGVFDEVMS